MHTPGLFALKLAGAALLLSLSQAHGADIEIEGHRFTETVLVQGQTLLLNGAAISTVLSVKASAVALYLPRKLNTADGVFADKGFKRVHMVMLRDASWRDLSNAMFDRIRQNVSSAEFNANIVPMSEFGSVFGSRARVARGDQVIIDYSPITHLTLFTLNGRQIGTGVQSDTFFPMLLKIWIGPNVRSSLRDTLLGIKTDLPTQ